MGYSYGAVRQPTSQPALFIANDDDWEAEMLEEGGDQQEVYYEEQVEDEEAEELPTIRLQLSDVPESVYWDEAALTNCWTSALADYKVRQLSLLCCTSQLTVLSLHSSNTLPTLVHQEKHLAVSYRSTALLLCAFQAPPFVTRLTLLSNSWYGPAPIIPPSGASTASSSKSSKKKSKTAKRKAAAAKADAPSSFAEPSTKKHKTTHNAPQPPSSPRYTPASPSYQRSLSLEPPPHSIPSLASPSAPTSTNPAGPHLPTPTAFIPPPAPPSLSLPASFPPPPPIVELSAEELAAVAEAGDEGKESPEELLQAALWAWYNAGYQTGLYHAAAGVAGLGTAAGEKE